MLSKVGRFLRILRIDNGEILKDMADTLGVSSAFLSAVENGKKNMPSQWKEVLRVHYNLTPSQCEELETAMLESQKQLTLDIQNAPEPQRKLAVTFARDFNGMDDKTTEKILKILQERKGGDHGK